MAEQQTPVTIGAPAATDLLARLLGEAAADVIRLHMGVIDREDRLESGTGSWLAGFLADPEERRVAVAEAAARLLHIAGDATNLRILEALSEGGGGTPVDELGSTVGLSRMPLAERVADLVSAGLAVKIPEANQVGRSPAGSAVVTLIRQASEIGSRDLTRAR